MARVPNYRDVSRRRRITVGNILSPRNVLRTVIPFQQAIPVTPSVTETPTVTPTATVTPTITVTPSPLPSSCLDDARVTCGSLTVGIENGTGIFANKGWGHSVSLNNTENYYAEFTPVSGIAHNSIHFGILETVHPPCLDYWNYGCVYRFDGKGFRNGVSVPAFFTAPAMVMGNTYGVLYRGAEQKVTFLKNNVDFQTVSLSIGAPVAPTNTVYKFWMFNVTDGMCTGNFGPSAAFVYNLSSLSAEGVFVSARSICSESTPTPTPTPTATPTPTPTPTPTVTPTSGLTPTQIEYVTYQ